MATKKKSKKAADKKVGTAELLLIQFITGDPLLIPGTSSVAVRGQLLEIGPGKIGAEFPYRTPEEQVAHYGEQKYVLVAAYDKAGEEIDHADIERTADGGTAFIDPEDADVEPEFQNRGTNVYTGGNSDDDDVKESTKSKTSKSKSSSTKKKTSSKSKSSKTSSKDSKSKSKKSSK